MTVDLRLGDCLDVMRGMEAQSVDAVITSPPYDNLRTYGGHTWDFEGIAQELYRVVKIGGVVVWVVADETKNGSESGTSFRQALYFRELGFNLHDTMIYEVAGTGAKGSNLAYWQAFEFMFILSKGRPQTVNRLCDIKNKNAGATVPGRAGIDGKPKPEPPHCVKEFGVRTNIWRYAVGFADPSDKTEHPAPFPEALAADHIKSWSNEGDTILDPFMGSGTTGKMCVRLNRNFIGVEINESYFRIAQKRIGEAQAQLAMPLVTA